MDPDVRHLTLGFSLALVVLTLTVNVKWRRYAAYAQLFFPRSWKTPEKKAVRVFFMIILVGSLLSLKDVLRESDLSLLGLMLAALYGTIIVIVSYFMDVIVRWANDVTDD